MRRLLAVALGLVACSRGNTEARPHPTESAPAPTVTPPPPIPPAVDAGMPPLGGLPWLAPLKDGDDDLGVVSVPLGAREPRPTVVALHGGGDRPEWACGEWRGVTDAYPVLVCPRGPGGNQPGKTGLYWSTPALTKTAIARALSAARSLLGPYVADAPITLVGFSMGATQAAALAREDPRRFPRVALSENAYDATSSAAFAAKYEGERVLLSCTTGGCEPVYRRAADVLGKRGVPVRVNQSGSGAHGIWDDVVRSLQRDWPWLVEGARGWEGWSGYAPHAQ